jgi:hypothetical protein
MLLTNIVFSFFLNYQPFVLPEYTFIRMADSKNLSMIYQFPRSKKNIQKTVWYSDYQLIKAGSFLQSVGLIYLDIYTYTRPNLYQPHVVNGKILKPGEANPIADLFFKNNLWDFAFVCANAVNLVFYSNDNLYYLYSSALTIAEVFAISTWDRFSDKKIDLHANVFTLTF